MPKYLSASEYAEKHGVNYQYVRVLCNQGKIKGAKKPLKCREWQIPEDAVYPSQKRNAK